MLFLKISGAADHSDATNPPQSKRAQTQDGDTGTPVTRDAHCDFGPKFHA